MRFSRNGSVMTVDLHGTSAEQARELLLNWLSHSPESVTELRVVHGYNRGTLLRDMVSRAHPSPYPHKAPRPEPRGNPADPEIVP
ncbi:MAG: Smr/MutS family protein [Eubacteriales bacterium]